MLTTPDSARASLSKFKQQLELYTRRLNATRAYHNQPAKSHTKKTLQNKSYYETALEQRKQKVECEARELLQKHNLKMSKLQHDMQIIQEKMKQEKDKYEQRLKNYASDRTIEHFKGKVEEQEALLREGKPKTKAEIELEMRVEHLKCRVSYYEYVIQYNESKPRKEGITVWEYPEPAEVLPVRTFVKTQENDSLHSSDIESITEEQQIEWEEHVKKMREIEENRYNMIQDHEAKARAELDAILGVEAPSESSSESDFASEPSSDSSSESSEEEAPPPKPAPKAFIKRKSAPQPPEPVEVNAETGTVTLKPKEHYELELAIEDAKRKDAERMQQEMAEIEAREQKKLTAQKKYAQRKLELERKKNDLPIDSKARTAIKKQIAGLRWEDFLET